MPLQFHTVNAQLSSEAAELPESHLKIEHPRGDTTSLVLVAHLVPLGVLVDDQLMRAICEDYESRAPRLVDMP